MSLLTTELTTALLEPFEDVISNMGCSSKVVDETKTSELLPLGVKVLPLGVKTAVPKVGLEEVDWSMSKSVFFNAVT